MIETAIVDFLDTERIKVDLFNRFDIILNVETVKDLSICTGLSTVYIKLKVYIGEVFEYKYLQNEIKRRLSERFNVSQAYIELNW